MELLITDNGDGIELALNGADIQTDDTFFGSVYSSLFLGECFYNIYTKYKTDNSFMEALLNPVTSDNLKKAENAANNLLKWLIEEEIAESVSVFAYGDNNEKVNVEITIKEPDSNLEHKYSVLWKNTKLLYLKG